MDRHHCSSAEVLGGGSDRFHCHGSGKFREGLGGYRNGTDTWWSPPTTFHLGQSADVISYRVASQKRLMTVAFNQACSAPAKGGEVLPLQCSHADHSLVFTTNLQSNRCCPGVLRERRVRPSSGHKGVCWIFLQQGLSCGAGQKRRNNLTSRTTSGRSHGAKSTSRSPATTGPLKD